MYIAVGRPHEASPAVTVALDIGTALDVGSFASCILRRSNPVSGRCGTQASEGVRMPAKRAR